MPKDPKKYTVPATSSLSIKPYKGELLTKGTVPLAESDRVAAELAKEKSQNKKWAAIPENANAEGINKFQDYLKSKGLVGRKDTQSDEGYKKFIQPEIANFNAANPNFAITPEHVATLQNYHKSIDPRIVSDSRYGPETTQLRYPDPTNATVSQSATGYKGAQVIPHNMGDKFDVVRKPDLESGGNYSKGTDYVVEKSTGKIIDPSKTGKNGEVGYTGQTWNDIQGSGQNKSQQVSNVINSNVRGPSTK